MLGNCDKIIIPSTPNHQWPQNQQIIPDHDHKPLMTPSSSSSPHKANMADKTNQDQPLKCPRCDSSNTKFCYYNNYSLSQPRHFCKACKRYWTRGGTLRNVPVGGGCRKNKRVKRPSSSSGGDAASSPAANASAQPRIDLSPAASSHINNPLFYGLHSNINPVELSSFPLVPSFRVSNSDHNTGFDLQPQMNNNLGIGFSSSGLIQQALNTASSSATSSLGNYNNHSLFGSSTLASTSTMASLLASTFQRQKFANNNNSNNFPGLMPYEDHGKEVKLEGENRLMWSSNPNPNPNPNPIEEINSSDPSLWTTSNVGSWFDPSNMGSSSVPSLI
ncbi:hypothetical protein CDL12_19283 [Handroanthus impetiginosus]|uniref:Dof zinc finger protein n=1 Tax=Handroanthus impetiginosus TaxID=429701 RepID=A0A2G9GSC5_9LAMI|nr:hypothetical protein CDL12_20042 [Handroanthus impetiginosus]PIN08148.1 hypothetical protein CDL12_19283 [Handroanthus impetiginosus]